jgi:hypothetical protein
MVIEQLFIRVQTPKNSNNNLFVSASKGSRSVCVPYGLSFGLIWAWSIGSGSLGPVYSKCELTRPVIPIFNRGNISRPKQIGTSSWVKKGKTSKVCLKDLLL